MLVLVLSVVLGDDSFERFFGSMPPLVVTAVSTLSSDQRRETPGHEEPQRCEKPARLRESERVSPSGEGGI